MGRSAKTLTRSDKPRRILAASACAAFCAASLTAAQAVPLAAPGAQPPPCPGTSNVPPLYLDTHYSFEERAADLVSCMTLAEKVAQLQTNNAPAIPRLGVQQYTYWNESLHGIYRLGADTNGGSAPTGIDDAQATSFPSNLAAGMSWDPQLIYQESTAISDEARGFLDPSLWDTGQNNLGPSASDYGSLTYFAPAVNMDRDPLWGRADEVYGEDPYLTSQMADAYTDGLQGETMTGKMLTPYLKAAAVAKDYALYSEETDRKSDDSVTTDANVRDYYTAQFKSLVQHAHVAGIMTGYNAINGTPSVADTYTTNELLQRTYGFDSLTTSDCGAIATTYENPPDGHDWAPPGWTTNSGGTDAVWTDTATGTQISGAAGGEAWSLRAGTDLNCTGPETTLANIEQDISAGVLSVGVIDNALVQLFTARMETGEFDPRGKVAWTKITKSAIQSPAHQALAENLAANDIVLLKNDDVSGTSAPLLPANPATLNKVVIVGNLANTVTLGDYSGDPSLQVSAVQGITSAVQAADPGASVVYDSCGTSTTATAPAACSAQTLADIQSAGLVIVFAGTDTAVATEGKDRTTLDMPGNYNSLISQVAAVGNPRMALVIQSDGPVDITATQGDFPAIVFSGYNGESQGTALASVLFGRQDPAGHLDFTWYANDSQLAPIDNYGLTPSQTGGLGRTYMYFTGTPTYPFGYGLSYSTFEYSGVHADTSQVSADGTVRVGFNVTNTGSAAGATVAQLYVAQDFTVPGVELPSERLEGFARTRVLQPGQTQHITLSVSASSLSQWDEQQLKEVVSDGTYQFRVGPDSAEAAGAADVRVHGAITPRAQYVTVQPDQVVFTPGQTLNLTGTNPWITPDTDLALEQPHATADNIIEAVNNDQSFVNLAGAHVSYASTNPGVATVSRSGVLTAVAAGVTTIRVTVDGVTGTTPVVVQQPLALTAPALASAGGTVAATTAFPNTGQTTLRNVRLTLNGPSGWTATATTPSSFPQVAPGQTAQTTWTVTAPADAAPGSYDLTAGASFAGPGGPASATSFSPVTVTYPGLAAAFDNTGITDDSAPTLGNFDGDGDSYSAQALAAAGITPGGSVTSDGVTFTWPDVAAGTPDNVIAQGQTIALSGSGPTLGLLGTGVNGSFTGTGTVYYTDGTAQSFTVSYVNWTSGSPPAGDAVVAQTSYLNTQTGQLSRPRYLYAAFVPLDASKTVEAVQLPTAGTGVTAIHLFALAVG
jgi:beta-glucosidase-like glycosyl hydrolase